MEIKDFVMPEIIEEKIIKPCISIIVATHKASPERQTDEPAVRHLVNDVMLKLENRFSDYMSDISKKLENIIDEIDYLHNDQGLGIFVSPDFSKLVKFSFPVTNKIHIGESFLLRELMYEQQLNPAYYYLDANPKIIRFFKGSGVNLEEIKNEFFPYRIIDDYIYNKPSRGSSYSNSIKGTEKDKSIMKEIRFMSELKKVDNHLKKYLSHSMPLFISGTEKATGYFSKISDNMSNVAGIIDGNFSKGNNFLPVQKIYNEVMAWVNMKEDDMLDELSDAFGKRQVASGLEEVWHAAKNGLGLTLFVEKDFISNAFFRKDDNLFSKFKPDDSGFTEIADAVDYIMAIVLSKNGGIHIVENNKLPEHDRIALRLRYRRSEN
ncbi:MAG: hypothetical protein ACK452_03550 [Bacteroidota bacterium]